MEHHEQQPAMNKRTPTVSRVVGDTIVELVYDSEKRSTGLVVSRFGGLWNIERELKIGTGETLVPYSPFNNLIAHECVLLPSRPVEFGFKHELLADISAFLHRYVDLSSTFEHIAAHYVLMSWVYDAFSELPYLRLRGEYGTGKTRGLLAIGSLCYKSFFASGASTLSPLFHTLDAFGGTLVLDEADFRFSDASNELVKLFNNGTTRGMPLLRTIVNRYKEFNPYAFRVFGPKIIAMRGRFEDQALESRFITEETGARPLRSDIPIQLPKSLKDEARELRNRLLHFRLCNLFSIKSDPSLLIAGAAPRLNQTALSLLSLVDDQELRREIADFLERGNDALLSERRHSAEAGLATAVSAAFAAASTPFVSVRDIAERFNAAHIDEYGRPMSNKWVGHMLRKRFNLSTHKSNGVYVIPVSERSKVDALVQRFNIGESHTEGESQAVQ
jgi:hypothetical protein